MKCSDHIFHKEQKMIGEHLQTTVLDHHGLVAAQCQEIKLAQRINDRLGAKDPRRIVSPGTAVVAMILNGLGFTNRRLYLTHQFFESKPVEKLLGPGINASHLNDDALGDALDEIASYGASRLFGEIAFEIGLESNLLSRQQHVDTTSFSLHGRYEVDDTAEVIEVTRGYSKAHRPDLKQVILSLVVNGKACLPVWMDPCDGNASDKTTLPETIEHVEKFCAQLDCEKRFKWVADSGLYSSGKLLKQNDYLWLSRVPETIKEAKILVAKASEEITNGYKIAPFHSSFGDIEQRWILVFSEQAFEREKKTVEKKLNTQEEELNKKLWHLGVHPFGCEQDALLEIKKLKKAYPCFLITHEIEFIEKYTKPGRPQAGDTKTLAGYRLKAKAVRDEELIHKMLHSKGRFILATNDLDTANYPDERLLEEYKEQQKVEGGFRFLKDPWFMVDSVFLKSPKRIEALMMVMTLCLLIYNLTQYQLRERLKIQNETLPNQLGKPVQNPTLRWIFQLMEGIAVVQLCDEAYHVLHEAVSNLNPVRQKIIRLLGPRACDIYQISFEISGM